MPKDAPHRVEIRNGTDWGVYNSLTITGRIAHGTMRIKNGGRTGFGHGCYRLKKVFIPNTGHLRIGDGHPSFSMPLRILRRRHPFVSIDQDDFHVSLCNRIDNWSPGASSSSEINWYCRLDSLNSGESVMGTFVPDAIAHSSPATSLCLD